MIRERVVEIVKSGAFCPICKVNAMMPSRCVVP